MAQDNQQPKEEAPSASNAPQGQSGPIEAAPMGNDQTDQQNQQMLQAAGELGDQIIQIAGPEGLAKILQEGLQGLMQQGQQGPQQGAPTGAAGLPSAAPEPGGAGFGPAFG